MTVALGVVGAATSHAFDFVELLAGEGYELTAVLERDPRWAERAESLVRDSGNAVAVTTLDELCERTEVVLLLDPNWDARVADAVTVLAAGRTAFVDKPMGGSPERLDELAAAAAGTSRLFGGSALRHPPRAVHDLGRAASSVLVACSGHRWYYGIHAASLIDAIVKSPVVSVVCTPGERLLGALEHDDGRRSMIDVADRDMSAFDVACVTRSGVHHRRVDGGACYPALLRTLTSPSGAVDSFEPERILLALLWSQAIGGAAVAPDDVPADFSPFSGADFAKGYRPPS